jgi:hypothetical protein
MTHAPDISFWPGSSFPQLGLGLYDRAPMWGFALEMFYGLFCWWVYRGRGSLLAVIVLGNLANLSLFSAAIPGPEQLLAGHPQLLVTFIFAQIVTTLILIGWLAERVSFIDAERSATRRRGQGPHRRAMVSANGSE